MLTAHIQERSKTTSRKPKKNLYHFAISSGLDIDRIELYFSFFERNFQTAIFLIGLALQRKSDLYIPRKETARPQS
jgi:hypothetical protein